MSNAAATCSPVATSSAAGLSQSGRSEGARPGAGAIEAGNAAASLISAARRTGAR